MGVKKREYRDLALADIKPYPNNAKIHKQPQIEAIAESIKQYGWGDPLLLTPQLVVIAGHGRLEAAAHLGMKTVPCCVLHGLTEDEERGLRIADNRLAEDSSWSINRLFGELKDLANVPTGFSDKEIHAILSADAYGQDAPIQPKPFAVHAGEVFAIDGGRIRCHVIAAPFAATKRKDGLLVTRQHTATPLLQEVLRGVQLLLTTAALAAQNTAPLAATLPPNALLLAFTDPAAPAAHALEEAYRIHTNLHADLTARQLLTTFAVVPETALHPGGESITVFGAAEQTHWRVWHTEGSEPQIAAAYQSIYAFAAPAHVPLQKVPRVKGAQAVLTHGHIFTQNAAQITERNAQLLLDIVSPNKTAGVVVAGLNNHLGLLLALTRGSYKAHLFLTPEDAADYLKYCRDRLLVRIQHVKIKQCS